MVLRELIETLAIEHSWSKQYGYDRVDMDSEAGRCFVLLPSEVSQERSLRWVWYAPTFIGMHPAEENGWICSKLLDNGFAICGVDVGESYGCPEGTRRFSLFYEMLVRDLGFSEKPCLWAQSRGALMLYNWAAKHPDLVSCIAGTYPVCNLESYPGLEIASKAYGMNVDELRSSLSRYNPIDILQPLAECGVPILHIHGDTDTVVPIEANTAILAKRYRELDGDIEVVVAKGKGHDLDDEFFKSQLFVDFIISHGKMER